LPSRLLSPYLSPWRSHGTHDPKVKLPRNVSPLLSCTMHNTAVEPSRRELAWQLRTRGNGFCVRGRLALVMRSHSFSSWRGPCMCCRASFITRTACTFNFGFKLVSCIRVKRYFHFSETICS